MLRIRLAIALLLSLWLPAAIGIGVTQLYAETKDKSTKADQNNEKSGESPSKVKEVHKSLKSLDTKIPAETSKAVQSTKDAFKKRFNTTHETGKERK